MKIIDYQIKREKENMENKVVWIEYSEKFAKIVNGIKVFIKIDDGKSLYLSAMVDK